MIFPAEVGLNGTQQTGCHHELIGRSGVQIFLIDNVLLTPQI